MACLRAMLAMVSPLSTKCVRAAAVFNAGGLRAGVGLVVPMAAVGVGTVAAPAGSAAGLVVAVAACGSAVYAGWVA